MERQKEIILRILRDLIDKTFEQFKNSNVVIDKRRIIVEIGKSEFTGEKKFGINFSYRPRLPIVWIAESLAIVRLDDNNRNFDLKDHSEVELAINEIIEKVKFFRS